MRQMVDRLYTFELYEDQEQENILFDETGDRLSPTSANRNGKRHRYYVSRRLLRIGDRSNGGWRLPARQLEQVVIDGVVALLNDPIRLSRELPSLSADDTRRLLKGATELASGTASEGHDQTGAMLPALLRRVTVSGDTIRIELSNRALLDGTTGSGMIDTIEPGQPATIEVPFQLRRRRARPRVVSRWREATPGVCRARHRTVLVRRRRTAAECHDSGPADESGQSVPVRSGMLKSCGCDTMTAILDVPLSWRRKPRRYSGLTGDCRHRHRQDGKSSRNVFKSGN